MCTLIHTTPVYCKHLRMHGVQNTCQNAYHTARKRYTCTRACAPMRQCRNFFAIKTIANLFLVLREHCTGCCSPPAQLLPRPNQSPDVVRSRNPSKSMQGHDARWTNKPLPLTHVLLCIIKRHYSTRPKRCPSSKKGLSWCVSSPKIRWRQHLVLFRDKFWTCFSSLTTCIHTPLPPPLYQYSTTPFTRSNHQRTHHTIDTHESPSSKVKHFNELQSYFDKMPNTHTPPVTSSTTRSSLTCSSPQIWSWTCRACPQAPSPCGWQESYESQ